MKKQEINALRITEQVFEPNMLKMTILTKIKPRKMARLRHENPKRMKVHLMTTRMKMRVMKRKRKITRKNFLRGEVIG